ncbi:MAG: T9SS type A sorting domain-containing protein, partial [Bacteroidia bacterium]|nr:T9SS type A sorting domain-containing protein [Bacteroidia bacterium]
RGNSPVSFSWTPSAGLSGTTGTSVTASPALSSTYVVTAMNGACTSSTNVNVSVTSPPTLSIIASNSVVCAGDTTTLTASGASSYTWSGSNNTGTTEVVSPMTTSIYTLSNLTLPCGVVTETISIVANALPTVSATAVPTIVCAGQSTTLTATGASTYAWVGGPPTSTNVVSPTSNTSYTVTGTDANGCSDDEVVSVATNTVPVVSVSPQSPTVCASSAVTFTASGANTYSWSSGSPASTETVNPSSTTSYTVTGTNTLGCSSMVTVTVTTNPLPNLSISPAATATVCTSAEGSFTVSGASTYSWSTGSATDDLTIMVSTNTIITVEGTDANNCKSTATLTIVADPCTGIPEQIKLSGIRLFPNPSTGLVNIEFGFEGNKDIIITNSAGALIQKVSSPNTTEVINLSGYSKGIYFVKIQNEGRFADFKLIID